MMRRLSYLPFALALFACEPPYRDALRNGDLQAGKDPVSAASYYEKAVALGAPAQGHLKLAELAERQHAWEKAATHYAEARKALPKEPSLAHSEARVLLESGNRERALAVLEDASTNFTEDNFSKLMFGALASSPEHVALARAALESHPVGGLEAELVNQALATRQDPKHIVLAPPSNSSPLLPVEQLFQLAAVLEGNGRPGLSARLLAAGTQKYPSEYQLWYPLLRVQVGLRDYKAAQATMEKLPSDIRFTAEALMLQAQVHVATGDRAAAVGAVQRAIRALPEDATDKRLAAQLLLGQALLDARRGKDAAEAFSVALQLAPNQIKALLGKASAQLTLGEFDAARENTHKALEADPLDPNANKLHVVSLLGSEQFAAAKLSADGYVTKAPDRAEAWALRAKAQLEHSRTLARTAPERQASLLGASADFRKAVELNPREAALLRSWLVVEEELVGYPENTKPVRAWLSQQRRWASLIQVASYCNERNDPKTATDMFREATLVAPTEPQVWRVYAVQLENAGDFTQALEAQTRLLALSPTDEGALRDAARLNRKLGKTDQAIATYRQWLSVNGGAILALNNLAAVLGATPAGMNEAVTLAEKARELASHSPVVADTLGWLLFSRNHEGDRAKALPLLTEASSGIDNPVHHLHLAEALVAAGKPEDAKRAVDRALTHAQFEDRARAAALAKQLGD